MPTQVRPPGSWNKSAYVYILKKAPAHKNWDYLLLIL